MNAIVSNTSTISSHEIAELTGKRHANVLSDIRSMKQQIKGVSVTKQKCPHTKRDACYYLDKNATLTLITGYDAASRYHVFNRLEVSNLREILSSMDVADLPPDRFVYVAMERQSKRYKVGISKDPQARIRDLSRMHPEGLVLMAVYEASEGHLSETKAHELLADYHIKGEWYSANAHIHKLAEILQ